MSWVGHFSTTILLNISEIRADTLGWLPNRIFPTGSWDADFANLSVPTVLYFNSFSSNSAKRSSISFISDLVGDISRSEHQSHHFFQADSYCLIEDVLLLFVVRVEALSDISSASTFYLRLSRPLAAVSSALGADSIFLQDLSVNLGFFTGIFRSPRNHGWPSHTGVVMNIRQ